MIVHSFSRAKQYSRSSSTDKQIHKSIWPETEYWKSEGMNVGTQRPVNDKIYNIKFVNKPVQFLGIYVGENETACNEENWNKKILK